MFLGTLFVNALHTCKFHGYYTAYRNRLGALESEEVEVCALGTTNTVSAIAAAVLVKSKPRNLTFENPKPPSFSRLSAKVPAYSPLLRSTAVCHHYLQGDHHSWLPNGGEMPCDRSKKVGRGLTGCCQDGMSSPLLPFQSITQITVRRKRPIVL
jgi:hypothetical protein